MTTALANGQRLLLILATCLAFRVSAFIRMTCPQRLVAERVDPLITPGEISGHTHTVSGGNGFGFTIDYDQARSSSCSSCLIKQDLSNYWTPALYYRAKNGSFTLVPQDGTGDSKSHAMNVYYVQQPGPNNDKLQAFPKGLRMIAGDAMKRNFTGDNAARAVSFSCLDYSKAPPPYVNEMPNYNCPNGLRAQVYFPSCWAGGDQVDSDDHKSHMAYPIEGYDNGNCPSSHPVHLVSMFFEVTWRTDLFKDDWYGSDHPFVFAQGDPTGYGFHGDFVNGWDIPTLQSVVDTCHDQQGNLKSCAPLELYTNQEAEACTLPTSLNENIEGPALAALPGCNPVTSGPEPAVPVKDCSVDKSVRVTGSLKGPIQDPGSASPGSAATTVDNEPDNGNFGSSGSASNSGTSSGGTSSVAAAAAAAAAASSSGVSSAQAPATQQNANSDSNSNSNSNPGATNNGNTQQSTQQQSSNGNTAANSNGNSNGNTNTQAQQAANLNSNSQAQPQAQQAANLNSNSQAQPQAQQQANSNFNGNANTNAQQQPSSNSNFNSNLNSNSQLQKRNQNQRRSLDDPLPAADAPSAPIARRFAPWSRQPRRRRNGAIVNQAKPADYRLDFPEVPERGVVGSNLGFDISAGTYVEEARSVLDYPPVDVASEGSEDAEVVGREKGAGFGRVVAGEGGEEEETFHEGEEVMPRHWD